MRETDRRLTCSDDKREAIRASRLATAQRRLNQICRVYECKIVEKRLNKKQHEELDMLFLEGKWFYNHVLNLHKSKELNKINSTDIKTVEHFDKDKKIIESRLDYLSAA